MMKSIALYFWLLILVVPVPAAQYYVRTDGNNSNTGTANTSGGAWLTVQKAANTMVAGDSVTVDAGSYPEIVSTTAAGTSGNPITFTCSSNATLRSFGIFHDWVNLSNFRFTTSSVAITAAISFTGNNIRIQGNTISNMAHAAIRMVDAGGSVPAVANWPTNVYVGQNHIQLIVGVGSAVNFTGNYSLIESNYIESCQTDAIDWFGSEGFIRANIVTNNLRDTYSSPENENHNDFVQSTGVTLGFHATNVVVERNLIIDSYLQLYDLEDGDKTNDFHHWTFRNNIFVNNTLNGNPGMPFCFFYNNTYYHSPYTAGSYTPIIFFNQSGLHSFGQLITNNIFCNCGYSNGADGLKIGYYSTVNVPNADYNYVTGLASDGFPAVAGFSPNANSINGGDPLFVNAAIGDVRLTAGSPAIGKGVNLSTQFANDQAGTTRGSTWDIGAIAFTSGGSTFRIVTANVSGRVTVTGNALLQ